MGCSASKAVKVLKVVEAAEELAEALESKEEDGDANSNAGEKTDDGGNDES